MNKTPVLININTKFSGRGQIVLFIRKPFSFIRGWFLILIGSFQNLCQSLSNQTFLKKLNYRCERIPEINGIGLKIITLDIKCVNYRDEQSKSRTCPDNDKLRLFAYMRLCTLGS